MTRLGPSDAPAASRDHDEAARPGVIGLGVALTLGMGVSTFIAFALGSLAPFLRTEFGLSRTQIGALTTTLFAVGSSASPLAGRAVDSFGGRRTLQLLFAAGAASFLVSAVAPNYLVLLLAMLIGGVAMAVGNPATNKLVAISGVAMGRGMLMGVKQSGVQIAAFLAGALLPRAALAFGWRATLALSVAFPFAGVVATRLFIPAHNPRTAVRKEVSPGTWGRVAWLSVYAFLMGCSVATIGTYLPLYAHESLGLDVATAGLIVAAMGLVGIATRILWGQLADQSDRGPEILALLALLAVGAQALIWASGPVDYRLVWVGAIGTGMSATAWNAVGMLVIVRELRPRDTGHASGVVLLGFYGGYVVSPIAFGAAVDAGLGYGPGWAALMVCYAMAAAVAIRHSASRRRQPERS